MKKFGIKNVKAFIDTGDIEIAPITIFVGRNSCGKSSFIRFPQVLSQTFSSGYNTSINLNGTESDSIDYGTFQEVLHNGKGDHFSVSLSYQIDIKDIITPASYRRKKTLALAKLVVTYSKPSFSKGRAGNKVYATKLESFIDEKPLCSLTMATDKRTYIVNQKHSIIDGKLVPVNYEFQASPSNIQNFMPNFTPYSLIQPICKKLGFMVTNDTEPVFLNLVERVIRTKKVPKGLTEQEEKVLDVFCTSLISQNLFNLFYSLMREEFTNLRYIGPFRSAPRRFYRVNEIEYNTVGTTGDNTSSILINNDSDVVSAVSEWLADALNYSLRVNELGTGTGLYQITVVDERTGRESNIIDVGYGISQILPIVTQLMKEKTENKILKEPAYEELLNIQQKTYVIEQPELHLHPAAQSKLATLFTNTVINQKKLGADICLLIETHSEHLVRALQYLIASPDCELTQDMVKFYYVEKAENGESTIREMKTNRYGQFLEKWPTGFFDEAHVMSRKLLDTIADRKYEEALKGE